MNIEKLAIVIKSHVDDLHRCEQVMRDFDEHTFHDTADEINKAAKELEEAFAKALQQSSQPITVTDLLLKHGMEPSRADFAEMINVLQSSEPVAIAWQSKAGTTLNISWLTDTNEELIKQGVDSGKVATYLFTIPPASVPLEKYNKLLNDIKLAYKFRNEPTGLKALLEQTIAEAEGKEG